MSRWNRRVLEKERIGDLHRNLARSAIPEGYIEALEFVMKDKSGKYFNYVVVSCKDEFLEINWPVKLKIERKFIGYSMIFIDIIICTLFVFFIWYVEYHIRKHVARHRKITF